MDTTDGKTAMEHRTAALELLALSKEAADDEEFDPALLALWALTHATLATAPEGMRRSWA